MRNVFHEEGEKIECECDGINVWIIEPSDLSPERQRFLEQLALINYYERKRYGLEYDTARILGHHFDANCRTLPALAARTGT